VDSFYYLKKHIFERHADIDVRARYGRSVQKLIGLKYLNQFKAVVFLSLDHGQLDDHVEKQLSRDRSFKISEINWDFPIAVDIDQANSEKRRSLYIYKRDLLMKISTE
jgi:hypothetical protein